MTVTLNLPPQVEQAYLAEAQARGLPVEEVMQETLVTARRASLVEVEQLNPEEWMRAFKAWAHSHDHENLPVLSDEAVSRDSMYD
jgi:CBS domain-containing protein